MLVEHFSDEDFDVKRDMDLAREMLLKIEASTKSLSSDDLIEPADGKSDEKNYLLNKMREANLINCISTTVTSGVTYHLGIELTWGGHDFLDTVRDTAIWSKTKEGANAAGSFSFELIKALAKGYAKKQIEEKTGISLDL